MKMNETVCRNDDEEEELDKIEWTDYVSAVSEFIDLLERFIALTPENAFNFNLHTNNSLIRKPNYNKSMFDFAVRLFDRFHRFAMLFVGLYFSQFPIISIIVEE